MTGIADKETITINLFKTVIDNATTDAGAQATPKTITNAVYRALDIFLEPSKGKYIILGDNTYQINNFETLQVNRDGALFSYIITFKTSQVNKI